MFIYRCAYLYIHTHILKLLKFKLRSNQWKSCKSCRLGAISWEDGGAIFLEEEGCPRVAREGLKARGQCFLRKSREMGGPGESPLIPTVTSVSGSKDGGLGCAVDKRVWFVLGWAQKALDHEREGTRGPYWCVRDSGHRHPSREPWGIRLIWHQRERADWRQQAVWAVLGPQSDRIVAALMSPASVIPHYASWWQISSNPLSLSAISLHLTSLSPPGESACLLECRMHAFCRWGRSASESPGWVSSPGKHMHTILNNLLLLMSFCWLSSLHGRSACPMWNIFVIAHLRAGVTCVVRWPESEPGLTTSGLTGPHHIPVPLDRYWGPQVYVAIGAQGPRNLSCLW